MRINCHVHVFNLRTVLTPHSVGIIRRRVERDIKPPYGKVAGALVEDLAGSLAGADEEKVLRSLLERLAGEDGLRDEIKQAKVVPREVRDLLQGKAEALALAGLRRAVTGLLGLLRRNDRDDYRRGDLFDLAETLRIFLQADVARVTDWLMREIGPDDACVPLMMDITTGDGSDDALFNEQLEGTSQAVLAYPGRVLPFVFANPARPGFVATMERGLTKKGFVGVKLYPSLGYEVDTPAMEPVYRYCHKHGVPILVHCNKGGFLGNPDAWKNADPRIWRGILGRFPGLRVCFAHFGGGEGLTGAQIAADSWAQAILQMMDEFPGVYADIAFHRAPMETQEDGGRYFSTMAGLLAAGSTCRERILFGTDFWLIRSRLSEPSHWRFFEHGLKEGFRQIAEENPRRFLGLPGHGTNEAVGHYADFVAGNLAGVTSPPAEWLVDLVRERSGAAMADELATKGKRSSPSKSFVLPGWTAIEQRIEALANQRLDGSLQVPGLDGAVERATTRWGGVTLGLGASVSLSVALLNRRDGSDVDGILLPRPQPRPDDPPPQITFQEDKAWLKYRVAGTLQADAGATTGALGLGLELDKSVVFTDYHLHARDELARKALRADLGRLRFALDREDVLRLGDGEAVSFATRGTLAGEVTLTWADAFGAALRGVSEALGATGTPLAIKLDLGATVSARVERADDFLVVFSREAGRFRVALRKVASRGQAVRASIAAGLHFDKPEEVEKLIADLVDEHVSDLSKVQEARKAALDALKKAAEARIAAGFDYEYSRVATSSTLLEATLDSLALRELHEQLVQGDLSGLLDRARSEDPEIKLVHFLRRREMQWRRSWGFTLGSLAGKDASELRSVEEIDTHDAVRISYLGARSYAGKWLKDEEWSWSVDFKAQMREFRPRAAVTTRDFEYGLALQLEWSRNLNKAATSECVDAAVLWGALPAAGADAAAAAIQALGLANKKTDVRLECVFDHEVLKAILPVNGPDDVAASRAFAAAMPWRESQAHSDAATRRRVYGGLWQNVLADSRKPGWSLKDNFDPLTETASDHLRSIFPQQNTLWLAEKRDEPNHSWKSDPTTFGGLLHLNQSIFSSWESFQKGLSLLAAAVAPAGAGAPPETVKEMFKRMESFWDQTHFVRAAGAYLLARATAAGRRKDVRASLRIEYKEGGAPKQLVLGGLET